MRKHKAEAEQSGNAVPLKKGRAGASGGKRKKTGAARAARIMLLICVAALLAGYGAGWILLRGRFLPMTTVNGVDYSRLDASEAQKKFEKTYAGRTLTILEKEGGEESLDLDAIGFELTSNMTFQQLIDDQDYWLWPLSFIRSTIIETESGVRYDEEKLDAAVKALDCISGSGVRDPKDAYLDRNATDGYFIHPEDDGTRLDEAKTLEAVREALEKGADTLDLEKTGCYLTASVRSDDPSLAAAISAIKPMESVVLKLYMEGGVYVTLDKSEFVDWIQYNGSSVNISSDAVIAYTKKLADAYDTFGKERQFKTYEGDTLTVGGSSYDDFGYQMNQETSAAAIRDALMSGTSQTVALDWNSYGRERDDLGGDFGNTYVEISLDQQHMWYYVDGELFVDTDIVSGLATETRATPPGVFCILDKLKDHTMKGSYGSSFANYVMPVAYNGICIHDSSWRDDYGGDIWLTDGSHGCINTPYDAVKRIFENIDTGTPVIIYDRDNTVPVIHNETYTGGETDEDNTDEDNSANLEASLQTDE